MDIKNIDFNKPLLFEDEVDTNDIKHTASITGISVATVRRWMYEEKYIFHYNLSDCQ